MMWLLLVLLLAVPAFAGELEELQHQLTATQAQLDYERQRYLAAKAEMERAALVADYKLPELQNREKALQARIRKLQEEATKDKPK